MADNAFNLTNFTTISEFEDKGVKGAFKFGSALNVRKTYQSLSCNQALSTVGSGTVTDIIRWIVPAGTGDSYLFGSTGKIYKLTAAGVLSLVYTDSDGAITGAAEAYRSDTKTVLAWTTATKLHIKELPGLANWTDVDVLTGASADTYPKTNLTSTTWHSMIIAQGNLMIANKDTLAMMAYDMSYTNNALRLYPGTVATTLIERNNGLIAGAATAGSTPAGYLFSWEASAQNWLAKQRIPSDGVNALIDSEVLLMQAGTQGELYFSDMVNMIPVIKFPGGGQVNPGGVDVDNGITYWGVFGAAAGYNGIWSYGRTSKNGVFALNLEYPLAADEIGALKFIGSTLYVSYKSGTDYLLKKIDTTAKQTATYQTLDLVPPTKKLPGQTNWHAVQIKLKALPANCTVGVRYRMNKATDWRVAYLNGNTQTLAVTGATDAMFMIGSPGDVCEIEVTLTPSVNTTPEVTQVTVFFS